MRKSALDEAEVHRSGVDDLIERQNRPLWLVQFLRPVRPRHLQGKPMVGRAVDNVVVQVTVVVHLGVLRQWAPGKIVVFRLGFNPDLLPETHRCVVNVRKLKVEFVVPEFLELFILLPLNPWIQHDGVRLVGVLSLQRFGCSGNPHPVA